MSEVNTEFRIAIIRKFRTQIDAAKALGMAQANLSQLTRRYRAPSANEVQKLRAYFTDGQLKKYFGKAAMRKSVN